jgi:hypothetical protein
MDPKKTVQLCNAPKDPNDKRTPRCMLNKGHEGKPHESLMPDGQRLYWDK